MGDAIILPNGPVLFINGAQLGTTAWWRGTKLQECIIQL
jgi:hypothetical protein